MQNKEIKNTNSKVNYVTKHNFWHIIKLAGHAFDGMRQENVPKPYKRKGDSLLKIKNTDFVYRRP